MLVWKVNVMDELKKKGYTTYSVQKNKQISSGSLNDICKGRMVKTTLVLDRICSMLKCQPSKLVEWRPDPEEDDE